MMFWDRTVPAVAHDSRWLLKYATVLSALRSRKFTGLHEVVCSGLDLFAFKVTHPSSLQVCCPGSRDSWLPAGAQLLGGTGGRGLDGRNGKSQCLFPLSSGCTARASSSLQLRFTPTLFLTHLDPDSSVPPVGVLG